MSERNWDKMLMETALHFAKWSKDPSTKVGAIIVDEERRLVATGYNGFPRGISDLPERYEDRELKYAMVVHAEANALLNTIIPSVKHMTLYATQFPCTGCAKLIIQAGIARVVTTPRALVPERWQKDMAISLTMFKEAGVFTREVSL